MAEQLRLFHLDNPTHFPPHLLSVDILCFLIRISLSELLYSHFSQSWAGVGPSHGPVSGRIQSQEVPSGFQWSLGRESGSVGRGTGVEMELKQQSWQKLLAIRKKRELPRNGESLVWVGRGIKIISSHGKEQLPLSQAAPKPLQGSRESLGAAAERQEHRERGRRRIWELDQQQPLSTQPELPAESPALPCQALQNPRAALQLPALQLQLCILLIKGL